MSALATIVREFWGLFVEDGSLALAIVLWVAIAGLGLPRLPIGADWDASILFAGLILILLENVRRAAFKKKG
jgi:hypothetical protein